MDKQEIRWEHYPLVAEHQTARSFIEQLALKGKRPKTVDAYARALEDLLAYFAGTEPSQVIEADEATLERYIANLKRRGPQKRGRGGMTEDATKIRYLTGRKLSDNTIAQRVVACRLFYDFLLRKRFRSDPINPLARGNNGQEGQRPVRGPVSKQRRLPCVPFDEIWERFVSHVIVNEDARTKAMILLAYDAALRREELMSLRVDDIDWAHGMVTIRLRHNERSAMYIADIHRLMMREMYRREKVFWDWSEREWVETLCPTPSLFDAKYGKKSCVHMAIMETAYLLGGMTDLRAVGIGFRISDAANAYFGASLMAAQCKSILDTLIEKGYGQGRTTVRKLRQCLSMACVLNRSPYLEDMSEELLARAGVESDRMRQASQRMALALRHLGLLPQPTKQLLAVRGTFDSTGMAQEWYQWCMSWYEQAVDLTPGVRAQYTSLLLAVGRWLQEQHPEIHTPEQWTEELAFRFRSDLCSWTTGQYVGDFARRTLKTKGKLASPIKPQGVDHYLGALRRYFTDLSRHPHAINGEQARRLVLDFVPKEVFTTPDHIRKALDAVNPRDIDLRVWAKLVIAAATLSQSDLPQGAWYPLSFYRALGLVWVTSARRPNEIARLRLDCLREDWESTMFDENNQPVEHLDSIVNAVACSLVVRRPGFCRKGNRHYQ